MIIDRLKSHGDRIVYRSHPSPGFNGHTGHAKRAAASLFDVEPADLLETRKEATLTWRAPGKRAPRITLTRPTNFMQVEGGLHVPAGESSLSGVILMASLTPVARKAARLLLGYSDRVIIGDGIWWVWTVNLKIVTAQDVAA